MAVDIRDLLYYLFSNASLLGVYVFNLLSDDSLRKYFYLNLV